MTVEKHLSGQPTTWQETENVHRADRPTFEVLVLDDSSFDQARIKRACKDTGLPVNVTPATDLEELAAALDDGTYDIVLVDYLLPKGDGLQAQRMVQGHPTNFGAAVVMVSSQMRTDVAVESMKHGSLDCLDKNALDPERLRALLMTSVRMFAEISRHWIGELLSQHRSQIAQDVARVIRDELTFDRFVDDVDKRIHGELAAHGLTDGRERQPSMYLDADEPFRFR